MLMFFLGHGGKVQGVDCILGVDSKPYPVNSILHKILDQKCAKRIVMVLDFCRNLLDHQTFPLSDKEINDAHEFTAFQKVTRIWSTEETHKATAMSGATFVEALCEVLKKLPEGVKVKDLEETLNNHWGEKQKQHPAMRRVKYTCEIDYAKDSRESTFPC